MDKRELDRYLSQSDEEATRKQEQMIDEEDREAWASVRRFLGKISLPDELCDSIDRLDYTLG